MKLFLAVFLIFISSTILYSQETGHNIKISIKNLSNNPVYLGYHYGIRKYVIDTILLNENGEGNFIGNEKLLQGVYLIITPTKKFVEILISENQHFSIFTDTLNLVENLDFKNSPENSKFNDYQKYVRKQQIEIYNLVSEKKGITDSLQISVIDSKIEKTQDIIYDYWKETAIKNKGSLLGLILNSMLEPEIPKSIKKKKNKVLETFYYKEHFFDNFDFSDSRILRSPVLHNKLDIFFKNVVFQSQDSIHFESEKLLSNPNINIDIYKYALVYLINMAETTYNFNTDELFVNIADKYFISKQDLWGDINFLLNLKKRTDKLRPTLLGEKAPEIVMQSYAGNNISMLEISADFTILFFWDPDCDHCRDEIPELKEMYQKFDNDKLKVLAVYIGENYPLWSEFIKENDLNSFLNVYDPFNTSNYKNYYDLTVTPSIFILDKDKRIIAKKIGVEYLSVILNKLINN
ncbi:MAG: hypothetical protein A2033_17710 [Bacteroidetes bacterium GWA2_31_9]|nr:MAG: hypothetical protein A2033_17710 [Bacteroidetes bacterium GWA2_31_9]